MVEGTSALGRPLLMNWSMAIWAVASCMATRSEHSTAQHGTRHSTTIQKQHWGQGVLLKVASSSS